MFAFNYYLLGSVAEELLISFLGLASDAMEFQLQRETLVWGLLEAVEELTSVWPPLSVSPAGSSTVRISCVSHECLLRKPC